MSEQQHDGPVVRDKRRIDPVTGELREPVTVPAPAAGGQGDGAAAAGEPVGGSTPPGASGGVQDDLRRALEERTADLQRVQAEYLNYRRRVERDREAVREQALANVLTNLLPLLDDVGRARQHGELTGGFKSVGEGLEATAEKLGLTRFGEPGEPFDPTVHEALMHSYSAEVTEATCVQILQPGYRIGERVVRPARVAVAEPDSPAPSAQAPAQG
ncbi:MAG: nucleotide exchange factor GrpE [Actinomycetota bacterium]|nr:nucleotide exchange factor GrpE [Actinomycetota bacterium]